MRVVASRAVATWLVAMASACDALGLAPDEAETTASDPSSRASGSAVDDGPSEPRDEDLDACVERLRRDTPRSVRELLADLGDEDLLRDGCRARIAEVEGTVERCAEIALRNLRRACEMRVAVASREPWLCPSGPRGRDPLCVALSSRQASLCRAAPTLEREACAALLGDDDACARSIVPEHCRTIVARHRHRVDPPSERASQRPEFAPELVVQILRPVSSTSAGDVIDEELRLDAFDRGARILRDRAGLVLELADPLGLGVATSGGRASMAMRVPLSAEQATRSPVEVSIAPAGASVQLTHPRYGTLRFTEGRVGLSRCGTALADIVEGSLEGLASSPEGRLRIEARFRTFVRDVPGPSEPDNDATPGPSR